MLFWVEVVFVDKTLTLLYIEQLMRYVPWIWQSTVPLTPDANICTEEKSEYTNQETRRRPAHGTCQCYLFLFGSPSAFLAALSPSASHLLAFTSCNTLRNCLAAMTGNETPAMTHGQKLSILFARASSIAHALPGAANSVDEGNDGLPG